MLTIFNRRELMVLLSVEQRFRVQNALREAGIPCWIAVMNQGGLFQRRRHGVFMDSDALYQYKVYVHKQDYNRAKAAIQPVLREF